MISLDSLNKAVQEVLESVDCINQEVTNEIYKQSPIIVHQRFCSYLVQICKEHPEKAPKQIPKAIEVMVAIDVLEELYPQLKR